MASIIARDFKPDTHQAELFITQSAFRAVMDAVSRPGRLRKIQAMYRPQGHQPSHSDRYLQNRYLETLVCMLLDSSCTVAVCAADAQLTAADSDLASAAALASTPAPAPAAPPSNSAPAAAVPFDTWPASTAACIAAITIRTYAVPSAPENARFAIITKDALARQGSGFLAALGGGSDIAPELGATAIIECQALAASPQPEAGCQFRVTGPGVKTEHGFAASSDWWHTARSSRKDEFPCGIDLILVDASGNVVALPRTAQVSAANTEMECG
jgi:alpha-D-ribose 1-methylphosphonate 5-triphosphate synthase subunit PhnH